jgi:spore coat polysaccharide biosynthesis protein SpsF
LLEVAGRPMLAQQLRRLDACRLVDQVVVATTISASDDPIVELAAACGAACFRGSEEDVLGRFVAAAAAFDADAIVRVTADCPLIDPGLVDLVLAELLNHRDCCDYASNVAPRTFPRGLDVEALYRDTLLRIDRLARTPAEREHVTVLPRAERRQLFLVRSVTDGRDNSDLRWTVDTEADLEFVRTVYDALGLDGRVAPYREVLGYIRGHPELSKLNAGVETWTPG